MSKFNSTDFIKAFSSKTGGTNVPKCPFCGNQHFTTLEKFATILIGDDVSGINLGPSIPSGMIVCEKCGHIEFFALGALGLLNKEGDSKNGK